MNRRCEAGLYAMFVALCAFGIPLTSRATGETAPLEVRSLAATCAACHGTEGRALQGTAMVPLAGYPKASLIAQMQAFRDGDRNATVMHQIARGYTEQQVETLATYFAAQPASRR
jgi:cytochrome subunit of sulfide dehydrogenase